MKFIIVQLVSQIFITVRSSCGKVMFSQASVILSTVGGGCAWQRGVRGRRDGHCSGRYASYWNAFLLLICLYKQFIFGQKSESMMRTVHFT